MKEQRAVFVDPVEFSAQVQTLMKQKSSELLEFPLTFSVNRTILVHIVACIPSLEKRISGSRERRAKI